MIFSHCSKMTTVFIAVIKNELKSWGNSAATRSLVVYKRPPPPLCAGPSVHAPPALVAGEGGCQKAAAGAGRRAAARAAPRPAAAPGWEGPSAAPRSPRFSSSEDPLPELLLLHRGAPRRKISRHKFPAAHAQFSEGSLAGACTFLFALAKPKVIQFALITTISPELSPDSDRRSL